MRDQSVARLLYFLNEIASIALAYSLFRSQVSDTDFFTTPSGSWNSFKIEVKKQNVKVILNGVLVGEVQNNASRSSEGFVGLQNHHSGSRVQFGDIRIKKL